MYCGLFSSIFWRILGTGMVWITLQRPAQCSLLLLHHTACLLASHGMVSSVHNLLRWGWVKRAVTYNTVLHLLCMLLDTFDNGSQPLLLLYSLLFHDLLLLRKINAWSSSHLQASHQRIEPQKVRYNRADRRAKWQVHALFKLVCARRRRHNIWWAPMADWNTTPTLWDSPFPPPVCS